MRKTFIAALAILLFSACVQEKIDPSEQIKPITFDSSFTAYATRGDEGNKDVSNYPYTEFYVWGIKTNNKTKEISDVFHPQNSWEGTCVYYDEDKGWTYDNLCYWLPGYTYKFIATSHNTATCSEDDMSINAISSFLPDISVGKMDGLPGIDYLYAIYPEDSNGTNVPNNGTVNLNFKHFLSKLNLAFKNEIDPNVNMTISNIKLTRPNTGSVFFNGSNGEAWSVYSYNPIESSLSDVVSISTNEEGITEDLFLYPNSSDFEYDIQFDVTLAMTKADNNLPAGTTRITGSVKKAFGMNSAYKLHTTITPEVIKSKNANFSVEHIEDWNSAKGEQQLPVAAKFGGVVTLSSPVEISSTIDVVNDLTINLNGQTITYSGDKTLFNVKNSATLTINPTDASGISKDGSSIEATEEACIAIAEIGSEIVINGGRHTTTGHSTYITEGGDITVNGGSFIAEPEGEGTNQIYKTLNRKDATGAIIVRGGSYYMWPPHSYIGTPNFNGIYVVQSKNDWYNVGKQVYIDSFKNLETYIKDNDVIIYDITADIEDEDGNNKNLTFNNKEEVNITNSGDKTVTAGGADDVYRYGFNFLYCGDVTLTDVKINGGGIGFQASEHLTLNNCEIKLDFDVMGGQRYCIFAYTTLDFYNPQIITINGGKYMIQATENNKSSYQYFVYANYSTVKIVDGEFYIYYRSTDTLVKDGSIPTRYEKPFLLGTKGVIEISGGTFGFDPRDYENSTATNGNKIDVLDRCTVTPSTNAEGAKIWIVSDPMVSSGQ